MASALILRANPPCSSMQASSLTTTISGPLSLNFTVPNDWNGSSWVFPSPVTCGGTQADGSTLKLELNVMGESAGEIYLYGGATLYIGGLGAILTGEAVGGGGGIFKPNSPNRALTSGHIMGGINAPLAPYVVSYDIQFSLPIEFDGTNGAGSGTWQVSWRADPPAKAPSLGRP